MIVGAFLGFGCGGFLKQLPGDVSQFIFDGLHFRKRHWKNSTEKKALDIHPGPFEFEFFIVLAIVFLENGIKSPYAESPGHFLKYLRDVGALENILFRIGLAEMPISGIAILLLHQIVFLPFLGVGQNSIRLVDCLHLIRAGRIFTAVRMIQKSLLPKSCLDFL